MKPSWKLGQFIHDIEKVHIVIDAKGHRSENFITSYLVVTLKPPDCEKLLLVAVHLLYGCCAAGCGGVVKVMCESDWAPPPLAAELPLTFALQL